ncbi:MAG TPA: FAD-dependent oxidoreductase [Dermatophilaceae bacterium]|nr:FAD-dependent oxidoreductase [Dermatophilaceae bacterium]
MREADVMATREAEAALEHASSTPLWQDDSSRPEPRAALEGDRDVDLAVVGGGFSGLWAALLALEEDPQSEVVVLEAERLGWAATGRNGGFCAASLTHGVGNGLARWPGEMPLLQRLGVANLDAIEATIRERGIDCDFERTGELDVAVEPWQLEDLGSLHRTMRDLGEDVELLTAAQTRALVDSPTYTGGLLDRRGVAMVNPARLAWGLADAVESSGGRIHESTRVQRLRSAGERVALTTATGTVRARQVVLATNVFPSPLRRARPYVVPVWDHIIATEPLSPSMRASLGWQGRQGVGDGGNQFHYYRLTGDNRLVFGGYDALYYYGSDLSERRQRRPETEQLLYRHMLATFPGLQGVRVTHTWGGAIDTSTRFSASWQRAFGGKVVSVLGYTGLGVGASRFGAQVCLDLLAGRDNDRTRLEMVRRPPLPWPPEPLRWLGIQMTRRSIARADEHGGQRDIWLRLLDRLGLGFDS